LGITVERTFWNLWLPAGHRLAKSDGNMEPVLQELAATEKLDEALKELKTLNNVAASTDLDEATRENARYNFQQLQKSIESDNSRSNSLNYYSSQPGAIQQFNEDAAKARESGNVKSKAAKEQSD